jgi:hypothetical protein
MHNINVKMHGEHKVKLIQWLSLSLLAMKLVFQLTRYYAELSRMELKESGKNYIV